MGKRGPKPKPTPLRILEGNAGKKRINKNEVSPSKAETIAPPSALDAIGKTEWRRVVKQLDALGLYTELDRDALMVYCEALSQMTKATEHIHKKGILQVTPTGQVRLSPAVLVVEKAFTRMKSMMAAFGMTPSDRVGLTVGAPKQDDEFTQHQKRRFDP